jgi:hypothetical protein
MPRIEPALIHVKGAQEACARAAKCWNETALLDAIRSARYFLYLAECSLPTAPKQQTEAVANRLEGGE